MVNENIHYDIACLRQKWALMVNYQILDSKFGILFECHSPEYGPCILKYIPSFINRYAIEKQGYQLLSKTFMCTLYFYDDEFNALVLKKCLLDYSIVYDNVLLTSFFRRVLEHAKTFNFNLIENWKKVLYENTLKNKKQFLNYGHLLHKKIADYVIFANELYYKYFSNAPLYYIHGDLHRHNILKDGQNLIAIDPIGYIAPIEFEMTRFIGTELMASEYKTTLRNLHSLFHLFLKYTSKDKLLSALIIDIIFRTHNSILEDSDDTNTLKWLDILEYLMYYRFH